MTRQLVTLDPAGAEDLRCVLKESLVSDYRCSLLPSSLSHQELEISQVRALCIRGTRVGARRAVMRSTAECLQATQLRLLQMVRTQLQSR